MDTSKIEQIEDSIIGLDKTIKDREVDLWVLLEAIAMRDELIIRWENETGETWID